MNWPDAIDLIDQLHVEHEPPPQGVRERAKRLAVRWQAEGVSPPGTLDMSPSGDIHLHWKFPGREVICRVWSDGGGRWEFWIHDCVITHWPVEEA